MKKLMDWLARRFLPAWVREELLGENQRLQQENEKLRHRIGQLNAYIDGLETGIRNQRKIIIHNGEAGK